MSTTKTTRRIYRGEDRQFSGSGPETVYRWGFALDSSRTGNENPNWRQNILDNKNATTALTGVLKTLKVTPMEASGIWTSGSQKYKNYLSGTFLGDPLTWNSISVPALTRTLMINEAQAKARTYASRRLAKYQDPFKGSQETLGELRETVRFLRHPLQTLTNLTRNMAKSIEGARNAKGRAQTLAIKNLGEAVLEFNFGIAPLVSEIAEIKNVIEDHLLEFREKNRVYGMSSDYVVTSFNGADSGTGFWAWDKTVTTQAKAECFIHFGILIEKLLTHDQLLDKIPDELLKLETVPSLLWEFTPLSVFVDYVVNVGDIITAATQATGAVSYNSESTVLTMTKTYTNSRIRSTSANMKVTSVLSEGSTILTTRSVDRVGGSLGIPPMVFHLPGSNISYMNIAALIASANFKPVNHIRLPKAYANGF